MVENEINTLIVESKSNKYIYLIQVAVLIAVGVMFYPSLQSMLEGDTVHRFMLVVSLLMYLGFILLLSVVPVLIQKRKRQRRQQLKEKKELERQYIQQCEEETLKAMMFNTTPAKSNEIMPNYTRMNERSDPYVAKPKGFRAQSYDLTESREQYMKGPDSILFDASTRVMQAEQEEDEQKQRQAFVTVLKNQGMHYSDNDLNNFLSGISHNSIM